MQKSTKILIAYDGSDFSDAALADLDRAGIPDDAEAVLLSVADAGDPPGLTDRAVPETGKVPMQSAETIRQHLHEMIEQTRVTAESAADRIRGMFPSWNVSARAVTGSPAAELIKTADEWKADVIVVGSHGRGFLGRAVLGSVSMKVLHEAACSVRIARASVSAPGSPTRVLIAVDGSPNADLALDHVLERTWPESTEFRLITADNDPGSRPETSVLDMVPEGKEDSPEAKAWVDRVLRGPSRKIKSAGLNVSQACRWGDAADVILNEATGWKADSIFVGARGLGRFHRLMIGSVSGAVAAKAKCSVEVVRDNTGNPLIIE
ncbi:MAG: universal stress protein [Blastocatellia bacterium]|nr:universal stress protein [Blastocatellia bacterium]